MGESKRTDFLLSYKSNIPVAIIEAKDNNHGIGDGMQQELVYAEMMDVPFVYSTNGDAFIEHDRTANFWATYRCYNKWNRQSLD